MGVETTVEDGEDASGDEFDEDVEVELVKLELRE
jgi:hypothetical protein